jgi:hypothetical protein
MIRMGARMPPLVPEPRARRPDDELDHQDADEGTDGEVAGNLLTDGLVADTERPRLDQSTDSHNEAAERRPPDPVDR